jgi:prepilin-type N-terminal cleavage/methylation domain-containing protein
MKSIKEAGFTLIELVIVIVILGILAATAAPKFMNLQKDARIAKLEGYAGALKSAISMVHSKAMIRSDLNYVCIANGVDPASCSEEDKISLTANRYPDNAVLKAMDLCYMYCGSNIEQCGSPVGCTDKSDVEIVASNFGGLDLVTALIVPYDHALKRGSSSDVFNLDTTCGIKYTYSVGSSSDTFEPYVELVTEGC